jgi:carbamoyltransferase
MKILGFYLGGHDSSAVIYDDKTSEIKYLKSERWVGVKHHHANLEWIRQFMNKHTFVPDVIVYSDGNRNKLGKCSSPHELYKKQDDVEIINKLNQGLGTNTEEIYLVDHHFTHILSCWPLVDTDEVNYGVTIDGSGDWTERVTIIKNPKDVVDKKYLDAGVKTKVENILVKMQDFNPSGVLTQLGIRMKLYGSKIDMAGKIMGAYAYGNLDQDFIDNIKAKLTDGLSGINQRLQTDIQWSDFKWDGDKLVTNDNIPDRAKDYLMNMIDVRNLCEPPYDLDNQTFVDYLTTNHHLIGEIVEDLFLETITDKDSIVTYSGGTAQNTVWNEILFSHFKNLHIPPHAYDGGLSLGCVEFARILFDLKKMKFDNFPFIQDDKELTEPDEATIDEVVDLLVDGKIVGWFQGAGEVGPRALGNRSILMHPGLKDGKDIINERVKHREYWRPFAPSVLEEHAHEWFTLNEPSPYMLRAVTTREDKRDIIPSVTHKDYSSRVQTISKEQNNLYYTLIKKFYDKTGIPLVLNTSLNDGGYPIFSHREQCIKFLKNSDFDAMCIGSKLYYKDSINDIK